MKAFKLIGAAAAASLLLLTSCLGESNNTVTRAGFGVAGLSEKTYKTVLNTIHVGPEGIVLKQKAHFSLAGWNVNPQGAVKNNLVADGNAAAGWSLQSGDHPQGSGLAAAGGTQQGDKGVVLDDHAQVVHRVKFSPPLGHMF